VEVLSRVAMQENPHVDDLLVAMIKIVDSGEVPEDQGAKAALPRELVHARALVDAFSLQLSPNGASRRTWELSAYAKTLDSRFCPVARSRRLLRCWICLASFPTYMPQITSVVRSS
jgi:hypothetical protein